MSPAFLFGLVLAATSLAPPHPSASHVSLGRTNLLAACQCRVGYRYFDGQPLWLGPGWTGFDSASGVYWEPEQTDGVLRQVFVHSPWQGGRGVAFADFPLRLPSTSRIRLAFQIGLRPTAENTDGVTYRIKVDGQTRFDRHCTWKTFRPFELDLSDLAEKQVTLRLEVDPGPSRDPTCDWSLWRDVEILAGSEAELAQAQRQAAEAQARRRAEEVRLGEQRGAVSLLPLTSSHNDSVCPGTLVAAEVSASRTAEGVLFECRAGDETIVYCYRPEEGILAGLTVRVNQTELSPPPFRFTGRLHFDGKDYALAAPALHGELIESRLDGCKLHCRYRFQQADWGRATDLRISLWPEGKSLGIEIWGEPDRWSGFRVAAAAGRQVKTAPAVGGPTLWRPEGVYVSTVADLMRSEASSVSAGGGVAYRPRTDGRRNAIHDVFYLTVSNRYEETLSNLTNPPSPFLDDLSRRVVLDAWGGSFQDDVAWLEGMARYGVDSFLMLKHVWQRDGYDRSYPDTMPANAAMGGDAGLRELSQTARRLGHRFCVHENYYDYYPNAEDFRRADRGLLPDGKPIPGWDRGPVKALTLKPSKLMDYAKRFSPQIRQRYQCDAAYHDIMPTWRVDFDAAVPESGKIRVTHQYTRELADYDRQLFGGPVVFEAADPNCAGLYDGGCNHGLDTYRIPTAVAYELLKVHPRMSNHGFGYYERWLPWGYGPGWNRYVMTDRELDKYRAYQIAFGRTGFIGQQLMRHPHGVVREYYLMQAFGRAYTGRRVERIRYRMDGHWVDAGTAARYGELSVVHVEYEGGQDVYVNLSDRPLDVAGHLLPLAGSLTLGPRAEAWTAVRDGQIADFSRFDDVIYADARSHVWQPSPGLPPILPKVAEFRHLEGGRFELTVAWDVGRKLDRDYAIFWHFLGGPAGRIAFQTDHPPVRPTTTWKPGETIVDGPKQLRVNDDAKLTSYTIAVGLYDSGKRPLLAGGVDWLKIGRLVVQREGAKATGVRFEPAPLEMPPGSDPAAYRQDSNVSRRLVDFGPLATDAAVVVRRVGSGWELLPVPLGEVARVGLRGDITKIESVDASGHRLATLPLDHRDGKTWFTAGAKAAKLLISGKFDAGPPPG